MNVDPNTKVQPFIEVSAAPKPQKAARGESSPYDLDYFEDLAGEGSSESAFCNAACELRKFSVDIDSIYDRNGRFDRLKGYWVNRDCSKVTTAELLARLAAGVSK